MRNLQTGNNIIPANRISKLKRLTNMNTALTEKIATQITEIPAVYGRVNFSITPERFTAEPGGQTELGPEFSERRPALLANEEGVARIRAYTLIGDVVAD